MSHGVHTVAPDFWTLLNGHAGGLTFAVALITLGVAVMTYCSQRKSEKLQKRATEIQDRMDAREFELHRSRAEVAMKYVLQLAHLAANQSTHNNPIAPHDYSDIVKGWETTVPYLPNCELKTRAQDLFAIMLPAPKAVPGYIANYNQTIEQEVDRFKRDLKEKNLISECEEKIRSMERTTE